MDVFEMLRDLHAHRKRVERAIARLEARARVLRPRNPYNRGRKDMSAEERLAVSKRMKAYWATRRKQRDGNALGS